MVIYVARIQNKILYTGIDYESAKECFSLETFFGRDTYTVIEYWLDGKLIKSEEIDLYPSVILKLKIDTDEDLNKSVMEQVKTLRREEQLCFYNLILTLLYQLIQDGDIEATYCPWKNIKDEEINEECKYESITKDGIELEEEEKNSISFILTDQIGLFSLDLKYQEEEERRSNSNG